MDGKETRIAVLSDTHGLLRRCVVSELADCSHILHAGDIIRESDLDELSLYGNLGRSPGSSWSGCGDFRPLPPLQRGMEGRKALAESGQLRLGPVRRRSHNVKTDPARGQDQQGRTD